ncbi:MAG TPA: V-type ATPase 116kDa subunit family protein [Candidatus Limnocylindrales bacterium]|nr:V-type ATPase 116kDa subunit family protein [Candidatus Limnocylindrales bacterium]
MTRVALVVPTWTLRDVLVRIAEAGTVQLDVAMDGEATEAADAAEALHRLQARGIAVREPALVMGTPRIADLEARQDANLLAGEVDLSRRASAGLRRGDATALVGWTAQVSIPALQAEIAPLGAAVVELPLKPWMEPPTRLTGAARSSFTPLVDIYGTVRYRDIDPTLFTAVSFVLMFGMMFADLGEGLLLALLGLYARVTRRPRWAAVRRVWAIPFWGGMVAALFGLAYGEAFGPTGLVPALWLKPMQNPITLVEAGIVVGAILLSISYLIGIVNRYREGGLGASLFASSGVAGFVVFLGVAIIASGWLLATSPILLPGLALGAFGIVLLFIGLLVDAGFSATGVLEALIELLNQVVRMAANAISFARLAAFGLVHAALGSLVWQATVGLWSGSARLIAPLVFLGGTAVAFALELLVAGVQALRLEYYELYSRIFAGEGQPFRPWHLPVVKENP